MDLGKPEIKNHPSTPPESTGAERLKTDTEEDPGAAYIKSLLEAKEAARKKDLEKTEASLRAARNFAKLLGKPFPEEKAEEIRRQVFHRLPDHSASSTKVPAKTQPTGNLWTNLRTFARMNPAGAVFALSDIFKKEV